MYQSEVEFSRTSSRTHFEVLGLEASSPRKLPIFWTVEILLENAKNLAENLRRPFLFSSSGIAWNKFFKTFFWDHLKKNFKTFFLRTLAPVFLVFGLGLERICPWPWLRNFFVSLAFQSPWPRVLCPQLHLCYKSILSSAKNTCFWWFDFHCAQFACLSVAFFHFCLPLGT